MKTFIDRIEYGFGVIDSSTEEGDLIEFRLRKNAEQFRRMLGKLEGETLQAKFDTYVNELIKIYVGFGLTKEQAFAEVGHRHC